MKAVVFTLGCKVNGYESSTLITGLKELGYETSDKLEEADLYIINTCAVTAEAEKKSRQAVTRARKHNPFAKIIVCGCASEHSPESFKEKGVSLVTGALNKDKIIDIINEDGIKIDESKEYYQKFFPAADVKTRTYIKVQDGCDNFCSYCLIPYLRGRSRSRKIESVIEELKMLSPKEAVITGINLSAFSDEGKDLADLLFALKDFDFRIRLGSLEDNIITEKMLEATKALKDFAPHFHLSLQSGSDKVLKEMNRRYTAEEFLASVEKIRSFYPDAAITTDIISGYSTETEEDFSKTIETAKKAKFADIHCFSYSQRKGTFGARLKPLPEEVKKERLARLMELKTKLKGEFVKAHEGKILSFLPEDFVDGCTEGYTENYIKVYVPEKVAGDIKKIKIGEAFKEGAKATLV